MNARRISRRSFLNAGVSAAAGCGFLSALPFGITPGRGLGDKPNVILIMVDDLNDALTGWGGHPQTRTPNISRLAERGMRFTNAHCNAPICAPSRASVWSGLYPHTSGMYGHENQSWLVNPTLMDSVTVFEHFMTHGYDVYGTGKIFHSNQEDNSVWKRPDGFNGLGFLPSFGPFPWDGVSYYPNGMRKGTGHPSMPRVCQEDFWAGFAPLTDIPTVGSYTGWSMDNKDFHYVNDDDRDPMPDEQSARWVAERLAENHENPFFITLGLVRPHAPRYVPGVFYDLFPQSKMMLPPYLVDDLHDCAGVLWKDPSTGKPLPASQMLKKLLKIGGTELWRRWIQSYLASVAFMDAQVGMILDALDASPHAGNTIVILTSDQGFHMGEKDHMQKTTIWEEVTRVPLIAAAPKIAKPGSICTRPVSLIDLYPTLIELCGLPQDPNAGGNQVPLDGHSLKPLLENPSNDWSGPPVALSCRHGWEKLEPHEPGELEQQNFSVRSGGWRYTLCYDGSEELYDHGADPHEWTNIAANPHYGPVKAALRQELCKLTGLP